MAFNPISGKEGSVKIGSATFAFGKWSMEFDANLPKVNNFTSGFQQLVAGLISSKLTLNGPYDGGNMPFTAGDEVDFILAVNNAISWTVTYFIESIKVEDDIDDAARITLTGASSGDFTPEVT